MWPFWRLLSLPGFTNDELPPSDSLLAFLCRSVTQEPSLRVVLSHLPVIRYWQFPCVCLSFHSCPSRGPGVCSLSTALWRQSRGHCCLHLQPLLCYPTAVSSLSSLYDMAWGWMVGSPAFLPSHCFSSMHLTLQSNCFTCLNSQALALIDFTNDWIAPLPLCLLKSEPIRSRLSQMPPHSEKCSLITSQGKMHFAHLFWASVGWYLLFDIGSCLLCRKRGSFIFCSSQW